MRAWLRTRTAALLSAAVAGSALASGCGDDDDFKNDPRPPVPVQLTGVITKQRLTVSPNRVKPGPIVLIVNNQTDKPHKIQLRGPDVDEPPIGPINPGDTGTVQSTLKRTTGGETYEVRANSDGAVDPEDVIQPARIVVSGDADSSSDELLLP